MNQKKCPKCGEMNPAEAVMCWACYTPLGSAGPGGAGAVATATAGAPPAALAANVGTGDDENKKAAIPPWQIAVLVIGLLVVLGFGAMSLMGGGSAGETTGNDLTTMVEPPTDPVAPPTNPQAPSDPGGGVPSGPNVGSNSGPSISVPAPYTMVVPPNPTIDWGVAAIIPNKQNISGVRAAQLANAVKDQFKGTKNRAFQIYVFADAQSAQVFSEYQSRRRGAALAPSDYLALSQIWSRCLACVEFNGNRRIVRYPSASPAGWWNQRD